MAASLDSRGLFTVRRLDEPSHWRYAGASFLLEDETWNWPIASSESSTEQTGRSWPHACGGLCNGATPWGPVGLGFSCRSPQMDVTAPLRSPTDWGAFGYFAGRKTGLQPPVFQGASRPSQDDAKQLCAALASGGGVTMSRQFDARQSAADRHAGIQAGPLCTWHDWGRSDCGSSRRLPADRAHGNLDQ